MLISHRKKFIYTKTAKTAGTSVESYFEKYCMPEGEWTFSHQRDQYINETGVIGGRGVNVKHNQWYNHMAAAEIRDKIGTPVWDSYFKFCVIRNPFEKMISWYFDQKSKNLTGYKDGDDQIQNFRDWISQGVPVLDRNKYLIDGKVCVDYFIRFEDLANGIQTVCEKLDLPFEPDRIPRLKTKTRDQSIPVGKFYTKQIRELVEDKYKFEMNAFEFAFPD